MRGLVAFVVILLTSHVSAQSGPTYRVDEFSLNAGGRPADGLTLQSAGYRVAIDSIGDPLMVTTLASTSFSMDVGFARTYPPTREVAGVSVGADKLTLSWAPERSVGIYHVYRGEIGWMPASYGVCHLSGIPTHETQLAEMPEPGRGFFYIVTAENTLLEEGPAGYDSAGAPRSNPAPCP
jgi:hypothetical protein